MKYLLLFLSCSLALAGKPAKPVNTGSPWQLYLWGNSGQYTPQNAYGLNGDLADFDFPVASHNSAYAAFLLTTQTNLTGNLTGKSISLTATILVTGNPVFVYGGEGVWNNCNRPANFRLYISRHQGYSNAGYTADPSGYFWSDVAWAVLNANTGTVTLSDTFDPAHWSNANGIIATDPSVNAAFNDTVSHAVSVGASYGGACYFDVAVAIQSGTGTALFRLNSFTAQ